MTLSPKVRAGVVAAACATAGVAAGIAGSAAAPGTDAKTSSSAAKKSSAKTSGDAAARARRGGSRVGHHGPGGHAVHSDEVVLNRAGTAFITETEDSGTVKSVSGDELTIHEAIGSVTYKDVTVTVPGGATVTRNGAKAALSDLKADDRVHVSRSSDGTFVFAADASFRPQRHGHGPGGPGHGPRGR